MEFYLANRGKERFNITNFFDYQGDCYDVLDSAFLRELRNLPLGGVFEVTSEEGRPDLIAYRIYNNVNLWWVILHYNKKESYADIVIGEQISYPRIGDLQKLLYTLKAKSIGAK